MSRQLITRIREILQDDAVILYCATYINTAAIATNVCIGWWIFIIFFFKNTQTQAYLSYRVFIISKIEYARCYFSLFLYYFSLISHFTNKQPYKNNCNAHEIHTAVSFNFYAKLFPRGMRKKGIRIANCARLIYPGEPFVNLYEVDKKFSISTSPRASTVKYRETELPASR